MKFRYENQHTSNFFHTTRTLHFIINELQSKSMYRKIRKIYNISKLDKQHNILVSKILNKTDFKWIQIHSSDNHQSHAVCVTHDYIFDCNASNALPMSIKGLNYSCGENAEFQGILYGYHFVKILYKEIVLTK